MWHVCGIICGLLWHKQNAQKKEKEYKKSSYDLKFFVVFLLRVATKKFNFCLPKVHQDYLHYIACKVFILLKTSMKSQCCHTAKAQDRTEFKLEK